MVHYLLRFFGGRLDFAARMSVPPEDVSVSLRTGERSSENLLNRKPKCREPLAGRIRLRAEVASGH